LWKFFFGRSLRVITSVILASLCSIYHFRQPVIGCQQVTSRRHVVSQVRRRRNPTVSVTSRTAAVFPFPGGRRHQRGVGWNHVTTTMTSRRRLPVVTRWTERRSCAARSIRCTSRPAQLTSDIITIKPIVHSIRFVMDLLPYDKS